MTKRTITLLLAGAILLSFVGCASETETPPKDTSESGASVMVTEDTEPLDETSAEINDETDPMTEVVTEPLPEETDAPVILPPETKPPETMPPETEAPVTEPPETEAPKESEKDTIKECKLIVRGKEIETKNSAYVVMSSYYMYPVFPLTATFEAAGGSVVWNSDTEAILSYNEDQFILDLNKEALYDNTNRLFDILILPPGGLGVERQTVSYVENGELMIEYSFISYLFEVRMDMDFRVDYDNLTIFVD